MDYTEDKARSENSANIGTQEGSGDLEYHGEPDRVKNDLSKIIEGPLAEKEQSVPEESYKGKKQKSFEELLNDSYINMDKEFYQYLKNFNEISMTSDKLKIELKEKFFDIVMILLGMIIALPYFVLIMFRQQVTDVAVITVCISSLAEIISAIIILPKIIAKYLFNKDEEEHKIRIITDMQEYNRKKRDTSESGVEH